MALSDSERFEILQLLADGKITAGEAANLLSSPKADFEPATPEEFAGPESYKAKAPQPLGGDKTSDRPTWFHVKVSDLKSGRDKVTVNIPLRLVKYGLNLGRRFAPELAEVDVDELSGQLLEQSGLLVDVQDEEDGEHVLIYVD